MTTIKVTISLLIRYHLTIICMFVSHSKNDIDRRDVKYKKTETNITE